MGAKVAPNAVVPQGMGWCTQSQACRWANPGQANGKMSFCCVSTRLPIWWSGVGSFDPFDSQLNHGSHSAASWSHTSAKWLKGKSHLEKRQTARYCRPARVKISTGWALCRNKANQVLELPCPWRMYRVKSYKTIDQSKNDALLETNHGFLLRIDKAIVHIKTLDI